MTDPTCTTPRVLLLPGWLDSGPTHWQSRWEELHGFERVQQADWLWPRRGDWMARLDEVVQADARPAVLVAHSLGCHLVAAWAAHTRFTARVQAALLVAVPDVEREDMPPNLFNWRPALREPLPLASRLLYSLDDPYATAGFSRATAAAWHSPALALGALGHVNGDSGLGDWPEGLALLHELIDTA
jgi:predicted alpha/beta hydrolase family esterase